MQRAETLDQGGSTVTILTPREGRAQLGNVENGALHFVTGAMPPGPRPPPGNSRRTRVIACPRAKVRRSRPGQDTSGEVSRCPASSPVGAATMRFSAPVQGMLAISQLPGATLAKSPASGTPRGLVRQRSIAKDVRRGDGTAAGVFRGLRAHRSPTDHRQRAAERVRHRLLLGRVARRRAGTGHARHRGVAGRSGRDVRARSAPPTRIIRASIRTVSPPAPDLCFGNTAAAVAP